MMTELAEELEVGSEANQLSMSDRTRIEAEPRQCSLDVPVQAAPVDLRCVMLHL